MQDFIYGHEFLGKGYRVIDGKYANAEAAVAQLFDVGVDQPHEDFIGAIDARRYSVPRDIEIIKDTSSASYEQCGTTLAEYESSFKLDIGLEGTVGAFKGSTTDRYKEDKASTIYHHYATLIEPVKLWGLELTPSARTLRNQLLEPFKSDLANLRPLIADEKKFNDAAFELFDAHGTHYVKAINMGGRLEYIAAVDRNTYSKKAELTAGVKASYKAAKASASLSIDSSVKKFNEASVIDVHAFGGNSTLLDPADLAGTFEEWRKSIPNQPNFTEFAQGGLVGIWELCDTKELETALSAAYRAYSVRPRQLKFGDSVLFQCQSSGSRYWLTGCRSHGAEHVLTKDGEEGGDISASYCWTLSADPKKADSGKVPIKYGDKVYFRNDSSFDKFMSGNRHNDNKDLVMQKYEGNTSSFQWSFYKSPKDGGTGEPVLSGSIVSIRSEEVPSHWLSGVRGEPTEQVWTVDSGNGHALSFQWMATADISSL